MFHRDLWSSVIVERLIYLELTLASQSMAHAYGADIIEIDVCLSQDDQLIVIHGEIDFPCGFFSNRDLSMNRYLFGWSDQC